MAVYKCDACGMSIGNMSRGSCDKELDHGSITTDDGGEVQVSKYPDSHGMIKSPMCCGQDMSRSD